jgi:uncharacterized membrane protein
VRFLRNVLRVALVLWAGSLWGLLWVAAVLFQFISDRHSAGLIAGRLFSIETYLGLAVAALALLLPGRAKFRLSYAAAALLAANEWILKPVMNSALVHGRAMGLGFGAWHGVSAALYVAACICVLIVVYQDEVRHA